MSSTPQWLGWVQQLQALAQSGLAYNPHPYDAERYEQVRQIAAEIAAHLSHTDLSLVLELFAGDTGHATPKVDVRGVIFRDDRILLVREHSDGKWTLPGGWADIGESAAEAVMREVGEESGYPVKATKLLAVYDRARHAHPPHPWYIYKFFFRCEITGSPQAHDSEVDAVDFFKLENLPELSTGRTTVAQITRFFDHARHPEWPTDFD
ncbi:MAG: NUDIX hydrolase [Anaerolineaceae bacterium]|nr:NUDIX hydrolase [Anaerolineaceae bacterium]